MASLYGTTSSLKRALLAKRLRASGECTEILEGEPVAIIGMACRFPGGANSAEEFWQLLVEGRDAIREVPTDRWKLDTHYDSNPEALGKMYSRWGGFMDDVSRFDADFFGISPREALSMDPQQRVLLEVSWEAMEAAGVVPNTPASSRTGVFVGSCHTDYTRMLSKSCDMSRLDPHVLTGTSSSVLAGRISYQLGFKGPSVAVDTACSSSLVSLHLACQSLRSRECDLALAGGVQVILAPEITTLFCAGRGLAVDGRCKTFDTRADGMVRSEGCGVVAVRLLSDAIAQGDRVIAVIRGSALNQDGRSMGLTVPNGAAQSELISAALRNAGVDARRISFVETHGTGTPLGDPIEMEALGTALGGASPPCAVASVKTNIGHMEGAAGIASLIKTALSLSHETIPPHLHFEHCNPHIKLEGSRFFVPTEVTPWQTEDGPLCAGVSAFGFSGTNAHVVLEQAPQIRETGRDRIQIVEERTQLLALSAARPEALQALCEAHLEHLSSSPQAAEFTLSDLCHTAGRRRAHHRHRLALVVSSLDEVEEQLRSHLAGEPPPRISEGEVPFTRDRRLALVFSGFESQWPGMGANLQREEPVFRSALESCDVLVRQHSGWSVIEELERAKSKSRLGQIEIGPIAVFSIQIGLAALWRSWGVEPDAVLGHSMGEVAAAHASGALSLENATELICQRSRLGSQLQGQGRMLGVELAWDECADLVQSDEARVSLAVENNATSSVLSGDADTLAKIAAKLEQKRVFTRWLDIPAAGHCPQVEPLLPAFQAAMRGLAPRPGTIPFVSAVTGAAVDGASLDVSYWCRNAREPVRFWTALRGMIEGGFDHFLEVSPHPQLYSAIDGALRQLDRAGSVHYSLRKDVDERATLLENLGALYTTGIDVNWDGLNPEPGQVVDLPAYPWSGRRFWHDELAAQAPLVARGGGGSSAHPFLGPGLRLATQNDAHCWDCTLNLDAFPYLGDHRSGATIILPASAYVELALAAANEAFGAGTYRVDDLKLLHAVTLRPDKDQSLQLVMQCEPGSAGSFELFASDASDDRALADATATWTLCASARVTICKAHPTSAVRLDALRQRCTESLSADAFYDSMRDNGFDYGESFRGVREVWCGNGEALARVSLPSSLESSADRYIAHPALLDSVFQTVAAAVAAESKSAGEAVLPVSLERLVLSPGAFTGELWCHATLDSGRAEPGTIEANVQVLNLDGDVVLEARRLCCRSLEGERVQNLDSWMYELQWQETLLPQSELAAAEGLPASWLILADEQGLGDALSVKLREIGARCVVATVGAGSEPKRDHYQVDPRDSNALPQLIAEAFPKGQSPTGVVYLWSLDLVEPCESDRTALDRSTEIAAVGALQLVQALAWSGWSEWPRLWLVTRGAQPAGTAQGLSLAQSPLLGLGRVVESEHPELRCVRVDLDFEASDADVEALYAECLTPDAESELALRDGRRFAQRLVRANREGKSDSDEPELLSAAAGRPFRLEVDRPGILERLTLRESTRRAPGPGEIEVAVRHASLNFKDVLIALGAIPEWLQTDGVPVGGDCAGVVSAVGQGVSKFALGDAVVAVAPFTFGSYVTIPTFLAIRKPEGLDFVDAAGIPSVFMTAHYALTHLARLAPGDKLLVHAASGGVGLAALQIAERAGAEVFATAGSKEKRAYLRTLGIEHVMDSRSLDFADEILRVTDGRGVDVVLNSLSGDGMRKNFDVLAPYGRFIEIGIRDIFTDSKIGLRPFQKSLSYHAADLASMLHDKPELWMSLLAEVMEAVKRGELKPLPKQVFPVGAAVEAFRTMARARHIGKVVLSIDDPDVRIAPPSEGRLSLREDGTYLISGGLGGVGLRIADRLVERGARHLVLMGRTGASRPGAEQAVSRLRAAGAEVKVAATDVTDPDQVAMLIRDVRNSLPPLRGVIHAAVTLDDRILIRQDQASMESVLGTKMLGAWNLHYATLDESLDFFVLFSSAAAILGNSGQGNYAAGNAFLDALAHHRRSLGRPGLSIDWGPWAEVGGVALLDLEEQFANIGLNCIPPDVGCDAFEALLARNEAQAVVMSLHLPRWLQFYPAAAELPLFAELVSEEGRDGVPKRPAGKFLKELLALESGAARRSLLVAHVRKEFGSALGFDAAQLDPRKPLADMGIDSLVAVELRNRLEDSLDVRLTTTLIFSHPTIDSLVPELAKRAGVELELEAPVGSDARPVSESTADAATNRGKRQREARARKRKAHRQTEVSK